MIFPETIEREVICQQYLLMLVTNLISTNQQILIVLQLLESPFQTMKSQLKMLSIIIYIKILFAELMKITKVTQGFNWKGSF